MKHLALLVALGLAPSLAAAQARAPYLQSPTETSIAIVWRTTASSPTRVCWGSDPTSLGSTAGSGASETDHVARITGLTPDTQYFYAVAPSCPVAGDPRDTFRTALPRGSDAPFRMWVVGDSGTGGSDQANVRDAMLADVAGARLDLFLHMGDMAYSSGTTAQFDSNFFAVYADILRNVPCWPTLGNHEGASSDSGAETGPYYEAYVLPADGSAGGMPSGTEAYYAFDWGNVHFVVLDSHDSPRTTEGAMLSWLDADLAAADATWLVVFFHHPPYTDGTHDSDSESQLIQMRENAGPILEAHGVDVVLTGHSHIYERSHLVRGAFDTPTTAAGHIADMGDGRLDGDGPYRSGTEGTLYVVAGHGGAGTGGGASHPLMYFSELENGSCVVDVDGDSMTLRNIRYDGAETDHVTLVKRDGLFLATPAGGETILAGSTLPIVWASVGPIAEVRIETSIDGGARWSVLVDRTPNDGLYDWSTPRIATTRARVRISDADDASAADESGDFTLSAESRGVVIPFGDLWQYSDEGTDHGEAWRMGEGTWPEGRAELGYGDGDEATVLHDEDPNIPTVYFRRSIVIDGEVTFARLRGLYDDGIAVWINGQLVSSHDADDFAFASWASAGAASEQTFDETLDLSARSPFVMGTNWIAVIVKQSSSSSSDVSFDLELELGVRRELAMPDGGTTIDDGGPLAEGDAAAVAPDASTEAPLEGGCGCRAAARDGHRGWMLALALVGIALRSRRARRR